MGQAIARRLSQEAARVLTVQREDDGEFEGIAADFSDPATVMTVIEETI